ncbi:DNA-processing protein DprA [Clostridium beijerinckii]|uniref:DNA-processing protein DprA n=1 Tax=Clostridium beijerinckii TaxID=1520 RepID=UPI00242B0665|nr:DNA-processing protein DprA [Clostridium beijerinckii]MDG5853130.1 DNA-processing protein DprA [Clostridium beijerinckii]
MNSGNLNKDSLAIMLLCSNLALNYKIDKVKPFTAIEWSKFAKILLNSSIKRPANLFNLSKEDLKEQLFINDDEGDRIINLLSKAGQLGFEINILNNLGINIMTRAEKEFPKVLKEKLKEKCPPVIYYCGDISILDNKLIGVVGSRNIDTYGLEFTKKIAYKIVNEGYSLVSGGARGADSISQEEVLSNGGKVAAFIADSMISKIKKKEIREAIMNNNLLLMSAVNPKSGFTVYSAMDRNKYIYCLSDITVVVSSDYNKGGTWAGATENLKNNWVPIVVRYEEKIPKGNSELIKLGGIKLEASNFELLFKEYKIENKSVEKPYYECDLLSLASNDKTDSKNIDNNNGKIEKENTTIDIDEKDICNIEKNNNNDYDVYILIVDKIKESLKTGLSLDEFKEKFHVNKKQANDWLNRAVEDGLVKKMNKPVKYKTI